MNTLKKMTIKKTNKIKMKINNNNNNNYNNHPRYREAIDQEVPQLRDAHAGG